MSDGGDMAENNGSPRDAQASGARGSPVAVAFVPPPREFRGSVSSEPELAMSVGSSAAGEDLPFPDFLPITLGCLPQTSRIRHFCLSCIQNPWFERVCMMVILLNCITLGMYQPCIDDVCDTFRCQILSKFDDAIFAFFTLEMTIKIVAMGFTGKGAYLADSWNRLDFFIVAAGFVEYCLVMESNMNLSAIRTIRVLRPLRAINRIPSMRILVMLLLDTLPMLGNVLLLCFFVFFIFGIVGVQLWKGMLRQRCFLPDNMTHYGEPFDPEVPSFFRFQSSQLTNYYNVTEQEKDYICSLPKDNGMHSCDDLPPLKNKDDNDKICTESIYSSQILLNDSCINWNQYYTECRDGRQNPFQGTMSFDNIGHAWVAIFLVISLEGWTDIMYYIQDAHSFWDWIYFVLLIVIGSFFMINLCLVVIATQFSETKKREIERMKQERARFQSTSTLASGSMSENSCYAEIIKYLAHIFRRGRYRLKVKYLQYKRRWKGDRPPKKLSLKGKKRKKIYEYHGDQAGPRELIIIPTPNYNSGPLTIYNNVVGSIPPPTIITPPEAQDPPSLPISNEPISLSQVGLSSLDPADAESLATPRRPALLRLPSGPDPYPIMDHLSPTAGSGGGCSPRRRRSSVMFSDVVLLHGNLADAASRNNVCLSEKTTQTEPEEPLDPSLFLSSPPSKSSLRPPSSKTSSFHDTHKGSLTCGELLALSGALSAALPAHLGVDAHSVQTLYSSLAKGVKHFSAPSLFYSDNAAFRIKIQESSSDSSDSASDDDDSDWSDEDEGNPSKIMLAFTTVRGWVKALVEHKFFQRGILVAILINTLSMGVEYHDQPAELTHTVEVSNIIFSGIFALEMFLKVVADGPFGYISNGFNVFDGVIVIISVFEMYESFVTVDPNKSSQGSSLSVLRTFRLLRILKLVRFMPQLRRQLFVMLRTMDNVAIFFSLLILFIFIFSVLGMLLFGGKFCMKPNGGGSCSCDEIFDPDSDCICDRKHFDNLLWATVTVFQILTQEDWNIVLFNGMEKTSHWAALYFVALMTFGNYVLFNLLVAILVEGFSAEEEKKRSRLSLENAEEEKKVLKTNEEWGKENQLRQKMLNDEPKCNIEKESQLLQLPRAQNEIVIIEAASMIGRSSSQLSHPPIITHTAATPQGSPHTTLDSNRSYDLNNRLSPAMALKSTIPSEDKTQGRIRRSASVRSNNASVSSRSSRSTSRMGPDAFLSRRESLSPHDLPGAGSATPTGSFRDRSPSVNGGSPWRRSSSRRKRGQSTSSAGSKKYNDCQSLVQESGSEGEEETALNNNVSFNNLNNLLPSPSGVDHSHCNGSMGAGGGLGGPRRSILTQQNSIGSPRTLSPQNSIRSSSRSRQQSLHTSQTSGVTREIKTTNLEAAAKETQFELDCNGGDSAEEMPVKVCCWIIIPRGCFLRKRKYALFLFSPTNPIRRLCIFFIQQKWFDSVILAFIGLNCITLAMERPNIPPDSIERLFLRICNDLFTLVFGLEMLIKVIAQGLVYGEEAYFSSGWNIMDGSLVIISVVDIMMALLATTSSRIFGILRVFRLLRALRPLRVINRAPGLKLVVQTLLSSLQPIGNIVLICCTFFIIFGILGVQLFKGSFFYCEGPAIAGVQTRQDCEADDRNKWINRKYNFDNLGQALMALFVLSSKDGWVNIMYTGLDAVGVDKQPKKNYSQWRLLYFISFLLLVGFFVLNMFVGVVVENFHRCREEQEKEEKARRAAKRAKKIEKKRKKMREPPYYSDYSRTRLFIFNMVTSKYFDLAIAAVIGLNVVTMALEYYEMPQELEYALQIFNYFFTAVFILESAMKVVALGCRRYIKDKWNQLDIVIVILSIVGIVLEEMKNEIIPINPTIIRVMRVLRIARVLKLLKMAKGIRALLDTVMQALPQVGNLGLLFFLLFFIFAALGVELFGRLECDEIHPCQGLGEHAHFKNFGMAFLTLFRVATGDNWNGIMKDTLRDECSYESGCVKNCCLYPFVAPIFFVIFVLMAQFVLVNVVVAVLMKHLEESHKQVQMEDEFDLDVEIERQLAQEEEDIAEMQETLKIAHEKIKTIQQYANKNGRGDSIPKGLILQHMPVKKVPSLPDNFVFRGHRGSDPVVSFSRGSPYSDDLFRRKGDFIYAIPSININAPEPKRRESIQVTLYPREKNTSIKRAVSMGRNERLPPQYRFEASPSLLQDTLRHRSPLASTSRNIIRKNSQKDKFPPCRLNRDGSSKRVKIDPNTQEGQKQRQLRWHGRRKSSSCSNQVVSIEDSISNSLMASFDMNSRFDMDSTSCSVCSSEEASNLSSGHNSKPNRFNPVAPVALSIDRMFDDDEATLASSTDSLTIESVPPDPPSYDSSSLSEAAANLPIPPSPPFPRRQDRQVRSVHGICPRPRPSSKYPKPTLSSSLNELPQRTSRDSHPSPKSARAYYSLAESAPISPKCARVYHSSAESEPLSPKSVIAFSKAESVTHTPNLRRRDVEQHLPSSLLQQSFRSESPSSPR